ncbi:unnamed protein product [Periconia digitata]|uniref:Uncharacterized protein n=1 Tax=Periconia digitata TaxID=1303443 RepID=A0A9W4U848_9PLEO|nr:unnamed protein product [Periconia digitata]
MTPRFREQFGQIQSRCDTPSVTSLVLTTCAIAEGLMGQWTGTVMVVAIAIASAVGVGGYNLRFAFPESQVPHSRVGRLLGYGQRRASSIVMGTHSRVGTTWPQVPAEGAGGRGGRFTANEGHAGRWKQGGRSTVGRSRRFWQGVFVGSSTVGSGIREGDGYMGWTGRRDRGRLSRARTERRAVSSKNSLGF